MAQPQYAKVGPADYERLRRYEWFSIKLAMIYMHHELIDVADGLLIDHVNQDSMDNRRANLRGATRAQNIRNRKKFSTSSVSKYKGIYRYKDKKRWVARIMFERKRIHLGIFRNEIDAAKAYDRAAIKYHGEFASLNFPQSRNGSH